MISAGTDRSGAQMVRELHTLYAASRKDGTQ